MLADIITAPLIRENLVMNGTRNVEEAGSHPVVMDSILLTGSFRHGAE